MRNSETCFEANILARPYGFEFGITLIQNLTRIRDSRVGEIT